MHTLLRHWDVKFLARDVGIGILHLLCLQISFGNFNCAVYVSKFSDLDITRILVTSTVKAFRDVGRDTVDMG